MSHQRTNLDDATEEKIGSNLPVLLHLLYNRRANGV